MDFPAPPSFFLGQLSRRKCIFHKIFQGLRIDARRRKIKLPPCFSSHTRDLRQAMNKDDFSALNEMASNGDSEGIAALFLDEIACQQMLAQPADNAGAPAHADLGALGIDALRIADSVSVPTPLRLCWTTAEYEQIAGALVSAALNEDVRCVQAILRFCPESALVECSDRMKTALNACCRQKASVSGDACFDALLPVSDASKADSGGRTNLMAAAMHGNERAVKRLLLAGADPKHADEWGETALSAAAYNGEIDCVRALLSISEPQRPNKRGQSALQQAVMNEHTECVRILAPFSDLRAHDNQGGGTAFDYAQRRGLWACADAVIPDDEELLRKALDECHDEALMPRALALLEAIELRRVSGVAIEAHSARAPRRPVKSL